MKIGSPADSVNSIVVNSVSKDGLSTKYARKGLVLSFFAKPDVSYYGGSEEEYIVALSGMRSKASARHISAMPSSLESENSCISASTPLALVRLARKIGRAHV